MEALKLAGLYVYAKAWVVRELLANTCAHREVTAGDEAEDEVVKPLLLEVLCQVGRDEYDLRREQGKDHLGARCNYCCPFVVYRYCAEHWRDEPVWEQDTAATEWLDIAVKKAGQCGDAEEMCQVLVPWLLSMRPLPPIRLTLYGDELVEVRSFREHACDDDLLWRKTLCHEGCWGEVRVHEGPRGWRTLVCGRCCLRVRVRAEVRTLGQFRKYMSNVLVMKDFLPHFGG